MEFRKNYSLKKITTMQVGGPAKFFAVAESEMEIFALIKTAKSLRLPWIVVGDGSNLVATDKGYNGMVIKNAVQKFEKKGEGATVGAGHNLLKFILKLDKLGLAGLQKMAGIPGTVGGAIYGCAGAYGQEIQDRLVSVRFFDGRRIRAFSKKECEFGYRTSVFKKHKNWIILGASFKLRRGQSRKLLATSRQIIKLRQKKYPPKMKTPGSFFKNIRLADLTAPRRRAFLKKIPPEKIMFGKIPAAALLDEVGARGMQAGKIAVANYHGNLIFNRGGGAARDLKKLIHTLKTKVRKKFGIMLEEEVQYLKT